MLDLGFSAINSMELRQLASADLQDLSDATGHTVNMAVLDGIDVLYIERCRSSSRSQRDIDLDLHVGSKLPADCTSMGKVLLADLSPVELEERLAQMDLARRGPNTITARARLREELARVRVDGVAVNNEELAYGLRSIAVGVRGADGSTVAAINLAVHSSLVSMECLISGLGPRSPEPHATSRRGSAGDRAADSNVAPMASPRPDYRLTSRDGLKPVQLSRCRQSGGRFVRLARQGRAEHHGHGLVDPGSVVLQK